MDWEGGVGSWRPHGKSFFGGGVGERVMSLKGGEGLYVFPPKNEKSVGCT